MPSIYIKTIQDREILFASIADVELYNAIKCDRRHLNMDEALEKYSQFPLGDALVSVIYLKEHTHWDYILIYNRTDFCYKLRRQFEYALLMEGLVLERELDRDSVNSYLKVYCPFEKLALEAERLSIRVPLKSAPFLSFKKVLSQIEEKTSLSFLELFFNRWYLDDEDAEKENISARFSRDYIDQFLPQDKGNWQMASKLHLFSNSQRNLITYEIVSRVKVANCKKVQKDIQILLQDGVFSTVFALHDGSAYENGLKINDRAILYQMWKAGLKCQPIHKLRAYFGERVAFHFAWLGHYSFWLFVAGLVGFFVFIFGVFHSFFDTDWKFRYNEVTSTDYARIFDNHLTLPYAWFISCWGVLYVQFWARRQSVLSSQWSTAALIHKETQRPLWSPKCTRPNPVTGKLEPFQPFETRLKLYFISGLFTGIMFLMAVSNVALYVFYNSALKSYYPDISSYSTSIAATLYFFTILTLQPVGIYISKKLTDFENHKTFSQYESALIFKQLVFYFVNYYGIIIYVAIVNVWIQRKGVHLYGSESLVTECIDRNCMMELTMQMTTIFLARSVVAHALNVLEPLYKKFRDAYAEKTLGFYIRNFFKIRKRHIEITQNQKYPQLVCDAYLTNVDLKNLEMDGYLASTVQFGFIVLFSVSFPVAPILAWVHNILQRKIDSLNILTKYKRPFSIRARNIGIWERWLTGLSFVGVAMNASIIAFTSSYFEEAYLEQFGPDQRWIGRLVFILVFEHTVLLVYLSVVFLSPSMPYQVKISISRQEYVEKLMRGEESFIDPEIEEVNLESIKIA